MLEWQGGAFFSVLAGVVQALLWLTMGALLYLACVRAYAQDIEFVFPRQFRAVTRNLQRLWVLTLASLLLAFLLTQLPLLSRAESEATSGCVAANSPATEVAVVAMNTAPAPVCAPPPVLPIDPNG